MADENRSDKQAGAQQQQQQQGGDSQASSGGGGQQSGDPGRTPGKAEGDDATVDESLAQKES